MVGQLCPFLPAARFVLRSVGDVRVEVRVRSGHTIDLVLEDGQDRVFANALHETWASPDVIEFKTPKPR